MPGFAAKRVALWETALTTVMGGSLIVTPEHPLAVVAFLEDTPEEDEWLARDHFIDGSRALLMRSILAEQGTKFELLTALDLYRVRPALRAFVAGQDFPEDLRRAAMVSIKYWKLVARWEDSMLGTIGGFPRKK